MSIYIILRISCIAFSARLLLFAPIGFFFRRRGIEGVLMYLLCYAVLCGPF